MPSESDRPIEKLMRDYVAGRKTAASPDDFKLHPITRNALKVEVVKVYGRRLPGENRVSGRSSFWPKLAWSGGGIFVLALLIVLLLLSGPTDETETLSFARNESVSLPRSEPGAELSSAQDRFGGFTDALPPSAAAPGAGDADVFQFYAVTPPAQAADAVPTVPSSSPRLAEKSVEANAPSAKSVRLATPEARTAAAPAPTPIVRVAASSLLASFQLRISGDEVTVIDQDQSRYVGTIRPVILSGSNASGVNYPGNVNDPQFPERYRLYSARGGSGARLPAAGQFTVIGTNLTTHQAVEFTGRMLTLTQSLPVADSPTPDLPSTVLRIEGTATINGAPAVSINATTTPQP